MEFEKFKAIIFWFERPNLKSQITLLILISEIAGNRCRVKGKVNGMAALDTAPVSCIVANKVRKPVMSFSPKDQFIIGYNLLLLLTCKLPYYFRFQQKFTRLLMRTVGGCCCLQFIMHKSARICSNVLHFLSEYLCHFGINQSDQMISLAIFSI